ncbi:4'-phosphopantetheinyl transferase [Rhizobium sp. NPDC090279]|uniref:4'-phosphopantetheinyl transferase family protein n=1 Tax=Rhizobium sp. NPDC090279 TaxID=3364499 RepID=UPI00383B56F0
MYKIISLDLPFLDGEQFLQLKSEHQVVGVIGKLRDYTQELYATELSQLERAVEKRRIEYAAGRHFARIALRAIGYPAYPIMTGKFRQPLWPEGIVGSITHSQTLAMSVVARYNEPFRSIGIDAEVEDSVSSDLVDILLTERELAELPRGRTCSARDLTLIFSAKEAVFKAVNPITNLMIDFSEIEIGVDFSARTWHATYVGSNKRNEIMNNGVGGYSLFEGHFVSFFGIPRVSTS